MDDQQNPKNEESISQDGFPTLEVLPEQQSDQSGILLNYESLIKEGISKINRLKAELKELNETIEGVLANDATYKQHSDQAKEAVKVRNATKNEVLKRPEVANVASKSKGLKEEVRDLNNNMSEYLQEYAKLAGTNQIEGEDGQVREIVYTAKLIRR